MTDTLTIRAALAEALDGLETIAAQGSGVPGSRALADCMAAIAKLHVDRARLALTAGSAEPSPDAIADAFFRGRTMGLESGKGIGSEEAWRDLMQAFTVKQRHHAAMLLGHEWVVSAVTIRHPDGYTETIAAEPRAQLP